MTHPDLLKAKECDDLAASHARLATQYERHAHRWGHELGAAYRAVAEAHRNLITELENKAAYFRQSYEATK